MTDDIALAVPRVAAPGGSSRVALPQPLAPSDAQRIRRVFALQAHNDIPAAIAECALVSDPLLLPDILADRYLGGPNRAKPQELAAWLASWPDLPDAPAIHALLATQAPKLADNLPAPQPLPALPALVSGDGLEPQESLMRRKAWLDRAVHELARVEADRALQLIARTRGVDRIYGAQLRAEVAQILFTQGDDRRALAIARAAEEEAGGKVGLAPFVAGLAAWRLERLDVAATRFRTAYQARLLQPGQRAAAAFWAARTAKRDGDMDEYRTWLRRASENGRTFYGLLARHMAGPSLGSDSDISPPGVERPIVERPVLGDADVEAVDATPTGHRAFALIQVGQLQRATDELRLLWSQTRDQPGMARSVMLVARQAGLSALADQLDSMLTPPVMRLPEREFRPHGGFQTDPALLFAIARMESNWDPRAVSPAGARGLMQLMPGTVDFILGSGTHRPRSRDPAASLDLGQRYLLMLAQYDLIGGDLIRLLAGYNSGPGSLGKWIGTVRDKGDPLLFIESVPNDETRAYIPRALAYTWLYAAEMKLPSPSLDKLASGAWPRFAARPPAVVAAEP